MKTRTKKPSQTLEVQGLVVRPSPRGWFGLAADAEGVCLLTFGHASEADVYRFFAGHGCDPNPTDPPLWLERAAEQISRYLAGQPADFSGIPLSLPQMTEFQQAVVDSLCEVGYGETVSYAELAERVGRPGAARAVGNVMRSNRLPLLIPCHRVVGAGNSLGGFSAPTGVTLKAALLEMEAADRPARRRPQPVA